MLRTVWGVLCPLALATAMPASAGTGVAGDCDFDGDGFHDLAIGVPNEGVNGSDAAGCVQILYGSGSGLQAANDQKIHQDSPGVGGVTEPGDHFGAALACGDLNGDGFDDLAIGAPGESVNGDEDAGMVHVIFGGAGGLDSRSEVTFHQDSTGMLGHTEAGDRFGEALAIGQLNANVYAELVIGIPGERVDGRRRAGAIAVLYGTAAGPSRGSDQLFHQDSPGVPGVAETGDQFARSLAIGDFDGDGYGDVAVGAMAEDVVVDGVSKEWAGAVWLFWGSWVGLSGANSESLSQQTPGVRGVAEWQDRFGFSVAAGDFDGDGRDDLAVGAPGESLNGQVSAGMVHVFSGTRDGLDYSADGLWHQGSTNLPSGIEEGDLFGFSLAAADFDGNGRADLAIGSPGEAHGLLRNAGTSYVLYGSSAGLTSNGRDFWHQDSDGVLSVVEEGDFFGATLSAGDFDGDGRSDLVLGAPGESIGSRLAGGNAQVLYGGSSGLTAAGDQSWHQDSANVLDVVDRDDHFAGFRMSTNVYRMPYQDASVVRVINDHNDHRERYDLISSRPNRKIVAAADGVVRQVVDTHVDSCRSGDGCRNNQVWIEHANSEWTKYTHVATGTVPNNVFVGASVVAGQVIGTEGAVGIATGRHLHFEVAVPDDPTHAGTALNSGGWVIGSHVIPRLCGIDGGMLARDATYTAAACN